MIPEILLDPELGPRYDNTIIAFVERSGLSLVKHPHDIMCLLTANGRHTRHKALNAVLAALEAHSHSRSEMIEASEFIDWVLSRVEVVDRLRTRPAFDLVLHSPEAQYRGAWRLLLPAFSASIPLDRAECERYQLLVAGLQADDFLAQIESDRELITV